MRRGDGRDGYFRPLTALHNAAKESSQRGKPLSVLVLDIDYFEGVNDNYGHDAGDSVLRQFASRVRSNIRGTWAVRSSWW
jgi:two-component system cell cycle response regulator